MATFNNPTTNTSTITNPSPSAASRQWQDATEQWGQDVGVPWNNPYQSEANPTSHTSTITNPTTN